jgi:hypothetical protein
MDPKKPEAPQEVHEQQDQSIKARKYQLFEERDQSGGADKPFTEYVRVTPPAALSPAAKAMLWGIGALVVLLFLAAFLFGRPPKHLKPRRAALSLDRPAVGWVMSDHIHQISTTFGRSANHG